MTFNVTAGYTETFTSITAGNITTLTGTNANQIIFQKSGAGANPVITAAAITDGANNAVIRLVGSDYVTFDGINVKGSGGVNNNQLTEYGFSLRHASATNGAQNNTIKNCTITLDKTNGNFTAGIGVEAATSAGAAQPATSTVGANSNNTFTGNTITSVHTAFYLFGTAAFPDINNQVGQSAATANTVTNAGDNAALISAGVEASGQNNLKIVNNTITTATTGNDGNEFNAIYVAADNTGTVDVTNNTITYTSNGTTDDDYVIRNVSSATTVTIGPNTIAVTASLATSGDLYVIYNTGSPATLNVTTNTISGTTSQTGGILEGIRVNGSPTTLSITSNIIQNFSRTGSGTGSFYAIENSSSAATVTISSNQILSNSPFTTSGSIYAIYNSVTATSITVSNNTVKNLTATNSGASGTMYGYYSNGSSVTGSTEVISGNKFWSLTGAGTVDIIGINATNGASVSSGPVVTVSNNSLKNLTTGTAAGSDITGILLNYAATNSAITADSVMNLTSGNVNLVGIKVGNGNVAGAVTASQNVVGNLSSTTGTAATVTGIQANGTAASTITLSRNKVYGLNISGAVTAGGDIIGIYSTTSGALNVYNNLVGAFTTPAANNTNAIIGISVASGTTVNTYYNSVYLAATSSGTNFGTTGIQAGSNTAPTTLTLRNNIVVNNSTPKGTGLVVALRRTIAAATNVSTNTNNNLYYAGTPGTNRLIYSDGTNSVQTLAAYKTLVGPTRETNTVTENVPFASTIGSAATFLTIDPTRSTQVESGGTPITGLTTDYTGATRNTTTPDIGAYEGTYPTYDIAVTVITAPTATPFCPTTTQPVTITLTNASTTGSIVTSATTVITVTATLNRPTAPTTVALSASVPANTTIAPNGTVSVSFTNPDFSVAGTYTLTNLQVLITDGQTPPSTYRESNTANNTYSPATTTFTVNPRPTATLTNNGPICSGTAATVSIALTGTSPWTFTYTDGTTPVTVTNTTTNPYAFSTGNLTANKTYSLTALSDANCTATNLAGATTTVTVNSRPTAAFNAVTTPVCSGTSQTITGTLTGTAPFTGQYQVNGGTPQTLTTSGNTFSIATGALTAASTFTISALSDANCAATTLPAATTTITITPAPTATLSGNGPFCGSGSAVLTGTLTGTGPWSVTYTTNGASPTTVTGISSSPFTITLPSVLTATATYAITALTDANCAATSFPPAVTVTVNPLPTYSVTTTSATCSGASTGSIIITASGGPGTLYEFSRDGGASFTLPNTSPYTYNVPAGTYAVRVRNATTNCLATPIPSVVVGQPNALTVSGAGKTDVTCSGANDGTITLTVGGGTGPYRFQYSTDGGATFTPYSAAQASGTYVYTGLSGATYIVQATDANNCAPGSASINFTVNEPDPLTFTSATPLTGCAGSPNANITVTIGGGTSPFRYDYSTDGGATFQPASPLATSATTFVFSNLLPGTYLVRVRDVNNCTPATTSTVLTGITNVTFNGSVNNNWYTAANWTPNCVPTFGISAIIPTGQAPVITSGTAEVKDLDIQGSGTLNAAGSLNVYGTFTTAGLGSYTATGGTTNFVGPGAQVIPAATFFTLKATGTTPKVLTGAPLVKSTLDLAVGLVDLAGFDLTMDDPVTGPLTSITGADATHYLLTSGSGKLAFARTGSGPATRSTVFFPIGTAGSYTPATLVFSTTTTYVNSSSARVSDVVPVGTPVDHVVNKTWDVSWGAGTLPVGATASLVLQWNTSDEALLFDRTKSTVVHFENGIWTNRVRDYAAATNVGTNQWARQRTQLTSFSPFAVQDYAQPLPVTLVRFEAVAQGANALLTWTTASEKDSRGFAVQVSTTGQAKDYRTLGFVESASPTSTTVRGYKFVDREAGKAGVRFYRLVQQDLDGTNTASDVRTVSFEGKTTTTVIASPNPFSERLTVEVVAQAAGTAQLTLVDALGRAVFTEALSVAAGVNALSPVLPVRLAVGTYTLVTAVDGQRFHTRLVKQ